jgi:hypothetical protein
MKVQVKINPVRIRIPRYGNALMLLMEYASKYKVTPILGKVTDLDEWFDIELRMTRVTAQSVKKYINENI